MSSDHAKFASWQNDKDATPTPTPTPTMGTQTQTLSDGLHTRQESNKLHKVELDIVGRNMIAVDGEDKGNKIPPHSNSNHEGRNDTMHISGEGDVDTCKGGVTVEDGDGQRVDQDGDEDDSRSVSEGDASIHRPRQSWAVHTISSITTESTASVSINDSSQLCESRSSSRCRRESPLNSLPAAPSGLDDCCSDGEGNSETTKTNKSKNHRSGRDRERDKEISQRKQQLLDGTCTHPIYASIQEKKWSYPNHERDRRAAMRYFKYGRDLMIEIVIRRSDEKERAWRLEQDGALSQSQPSMHTEMETDTYGSSKHSIMTYDASISACDSDATAITKREVEHLRNESRARRKLLMTPESIAFTRKSSQLKATVDLRVNDDLKKRKKLQLSGSSDSSGRHFEREVCNGVRGLRKGRTMSVNEADIQFRAAYHTITYLINHFSHICTSGGNIVRRFLGTVTSSRPSSPLVGIQEVTSALAEVVKDNDVETYQYVSNTVTESLRRADNSAYMAKSVMASSLLSDQKPATHAQKYLDDALVEVKNCKAAMYKIASIIGIELIPLFSIHDHGVQDLAIAAPEEEILPSPQSSDTTIAVKNGRLDQPDFHSMATKRTTTTKSAESKNELGTLYAQMSNAVNLSELLCTNHDFCQSPCRYY